MTPRVRHAEARSPARGSDRLLIIDTRDDDATEVLCVVCECSCADRLPLEVVHD